MMLIRRCFTSIYLKDVSKATLSTRKESLTTHKVVIVGGGTGGLGIAAQLSNEGFRNIFMIEPKSIHFYQPMWTFVGGGMKKKEESMKNLKELIPTGVNLIQKHVLAFEPDQNCVILQDGSRVNYDYLIVAAGIQINWEGVPGLTSALKTPNSGVVSIYDYNSCEKTFKDFEEMKKDESRKRMIFTVPTGSIKCAGAPQKIMWILEDTLRRQGLRDTKNIELFTPASTLFGIKLYADQLEAIRQSRGIKVVNRRELVFIDIQNKTACFKNLENGSVTPEDYDYLHVTPPMSAPAIIQQSPLADANGWMDVDKYTLQSTKFPNIFGLGDCTNSPNSKTAAAITAQAPVVVHNLLQLMNDKLLTGYYDGYASCPLVISRNKVLMAEFGYEGKIMESFSSTYGKFPHKMVGTFLPTSIQERFFFWLTKDFFPFAYWHFWVRGRWFGRNGLIKPDVTKNDK